MLQETVLPEEYEISHGDNGTTDPVILKLSCGFTSGHIINVVAKPADFFVINLRDNSGNILLHFILKDKLVLNSYFEKWGKEEIYPAFPKQEKSCVNISYEDDGYRIYVNGEELCLYKHRNNFQVKICEVKNGRILKVTYGKGNSDYGLWVISTSSKNNVIKYFPTNVPLPKDVLTNDLQESIIAWKNYECREKTSKICGNLELYRFIDYGSHGKKTTENIDLSYGFTPNHVISTVGITNRRFTITFIDHSDNILLSIGVRTDQNVVVLNSYFGNWGTEERPSIMPVSINKTFCITVTHESSGYRIFIDGLELAFYKHRSTNAILKCQISEGTLNKFTYGKNGPMWAILPKPTYTYDYGETGNVAPFTLTFKQKFTVGSCVLVTGYIEKNAEQFSITLLDDEDCSLLEFNPRFKTAKEKDDEMPLELDSKFTVTFVAEELCFRIYINGDEFTSHAHGKLINKLTTVKFENNVKIYKVIQLVAN